MKCPIELEAAQKSERHDEINAPPLLSFFWAAPFLADLIAVAPRTQAQHGIPLWIHR